MLYYINRLLASQQSIRPQVNIFHRTILPAFKKLHIPYRSPFLVALLVFLATSAAYGYYWSNVRAGVHKDQAAVYARQQRIMMSAITDRLRLYENLLRGGAGLFTVSNAVTQDNWVGYYQPYEISGNYPDVEGIGFSRYLTPAEVPDFLQQMQAEGRSDFSIFPAGARSAYAPVTYIAMFTNNTSQKLGFDALAVPPRSQALAQAAETGQPVMSGQLSLVSESRPNRPALIIYMPVFKSGLPTQTAAQRQQALYGFTYLAVDIRTMLGSIGQESANANFGVQLFDGGNNKPAYQSDNFMNVLKERGSLVSSSQVTFYGHRWKMVFAGSPELISAGERQLPSQAVYRGLFTSVFFAGLAWYLITYRERKIVSLRRLEVQNAKDELLSLASHQLRTPATVVKQYVGMLLQGYSGELTSQQLKMLHSAYDSNERQLDIINQLLYVARLDAGRISLRKERINAKALIRDVVKDQQTLARERGQQLATHLPKRALYLQADPRYLRMALENLLSNAIKYTPEGGKVVVSLHQKAGNVVIAVSDNGIGIGASHTSTIFEKFTRIENDLSGDVSGSGVGLYLTKQIITLHSGTIGVQSELGKGSVFTVSLPRHESDHA